MPLHRLKALSHSRADNLPSPVQKPLYRHSVCCCRTGLTVPDLTFYLLPFTLFTLLMASESREDIRIALIRALTGEPPDRQHLHSLDTKILV